MAYHFVLLAQYAALDGPLAMFFAWRALKLSRFAVVAADSPALGLPAESDHLLGAVVAGFDHVGFLGVVRRALGLIARHLGLLDRLGHFDFLAARMLSTRLGYGRPAFSAARLALDLALEDSAFGAPRELGRFLSQMGLG
jgi:hypothetical protein